MSPNAGSEALSGCHPTARVGQSKAERRYPHPVSYCADAPRKRDWSPRPQNLWAVLTREEAMDLGQSLEAYFDEDRIDPGWHTHIEGEDPSVLTIAIEPPTATVYVELLDEGVSPVWRPVTAHIIEDGEYLLPPSAPSDEHWKFAPSSVVRCEVRDGDLYATEGRPK